jgi:hypothetical protein
MDRKGTLNSANFLTGRRKNDNFYPRRKGMEGVISQRTAAQNLTDYGFGGVA